MKQHPIAHYIDECNALFFVAVSSSERERVRGDHGVTACGLAVGLQGLVNRGKKGSDHGCIIRVECKQPVEGCRLDIDGGVQLIELVRGQLGLGGLQTGTSRAFAVNPALGCRAKSLHCPASLELNRPGARGVKARHHTDGVGSLTHRNLHAHDGARVVIVIDVCHHGVLRNR